jgi:hypothetical protein
MKTLYAILNWDINRISNTKKIISKLSNKDLLVASRFTNEYNVKYKISFTDENVSVSKNKILTFAKDNNYDFCFILEDDLEIKDAFAFTRYINMMQKYNLSFIMYGYGTKVNCVLNGRPNPAVTIKTLSNDVINVNRFTCNQVMGFAISPVMLMFNEDLLCLESEALAKIASEWKQIPFNGFFFDIPDSWTYFGRVYVPTCRIKTPEAIQEDLKKIGGPLSLERNADMLIEYVKSK